MTKLAVWKFDITITDQFIIELPPGSIFLSAQVQDQQPRMWVLLDPESKQVTAYRFCIWGTGHIHDANDLQDMSYATTFQQRINGVDLVWHLFVESRMLPPLVR